jgi:hypothetical protein
VTIWSSLQYRHRKHTRPAFIGALFATLAAVLTMAWRPAQASPEDPQVVAVHTGSAPNVSMIIATSPGPSGKPEPPNDVSVHIGNTRVPVTVSPLASRSLSVALVIDSASDVPTDSLQAVQSGAIELLLRLPPGAHSMVVSVDGDPQVRAPLAAEPLEALSAISALRPQGTGSVAAGVLLAMKSLAAVPGPRAVIVYSNGTDRSGPPVEDVTNALLVTETIASVIQTGADDLWAEVVEVSGGDIQTTSTPDVVGSFRRASTAMSNQYVVAFQTSSPLPTEAEVVVRTGDVEAKTVVELSRSGQSPPAAPPEGQRGRGNPMVWTLTAVVAGLVLVAVALVGPIRHRRMSHDVRDAEAHAEASTTAPNSPRSSSEPQKPRQAEPAEKEINNQRSAANPPVAAGPAGRSSSHAIQGRRRAEEDLRSGRANAEHQRPTVRNPLQHRRPPGHQLLPAASTEPSQSIIGEARGGEVNVVAGEGDAVVPLPNMRAGLTAVHITGNPESRYFGVRTVETGHILVNTTDPYDGNRLLDRDRDKSTALQVQAMGPWTIEVRTVRDAPSFDTSYRGEGDAIVRYTGQRLTVEITGNEAGRYFGVQCVNPDGVVVGVVNTTRRYAKSHHLSTRPQLFEVQAVGSWTITAK